MLNPQYVKDVAKVESDLVPEALEAYHDKRLNLSNAHVLCHFKPERQRELLSEACSTPARVFVPKYISESRRR